MITPEQFKEKSATLSQMASRQLAITSKSGIDDINSDKALSQTLSDIQSRICEEALRVLVMGKFSSGKSTFLNALMGRKLLPAKPTPTTAIIGEIKYSDEQRAILFPKNGDKPFEIHLDDLGKYIVINHDELDNDEQKETPYDKVVIEYPLSVCKMGVDLVDSPGLDDPTCHDVITHEYLPTADAIVYCMNSQQAFSSLDKAEIEHLRALGYKSIIFVLTYFDMLEQNDMMSGGHDADDARIHYTNLLSQYTDLGSDGIFFVGSLPALMGKVKNDISLLDSSHILPLEKKLEQILFNERGRLKLIKSIYAIRKINRETGRFLSDQISLRTQDQSHLSSKLTDAQTALDKAKEKSRLIAESFKIGERDIIDGTKDRVRSFFLTGVIPNIESWVQECNPEEGISMFHAKRSATEFSEKCLKYLQTKMETAVSSWCQNDLVPKFVSPRLKSLADQQGSSLKAYEEDLKKVRGTLSLASSSEEYNISATNRILSAIAGVFAGGPGGAVVGGLLGWEGLLPALIAELVAGFALGIVALFTPVGLPVVIIAAVVSALLGGLIGVGNIETKVKKKLGAQAHDEILKQQETFVNSLTDGVRKVVDKVDKAINDNLNAPVNQYQKLLDDARQDVRTEGIDIRKQIEDSNKLLHDNDIISDDLEEFGHEINISF